MIVAGYIIWSVIFLVLGSFYLYIYLFKERKRKRYIALIIFYFSWCYALFTSRHNTNHPLIYLVVFSILFSIIIFLIHKDIYQHQ